MLEEMDALFGDQSVAVTPQQHARLLSRVGSPVPTLEDFNHTIPQITMRDGKPRLPNGGTGIINWLGGFFRKSKGSSGNSGPGYARIGDED